MIFPILLHFKYLNINFGEDYSFVIIITDYQLSELTDYQ